MQNIVQKVAQRILSLETPVLAIIMCAFWYASPIRDQWLWLLYLLIPIYVARMIVHRRLFTWTPLMLPVLLYLILVLINMFVAPYTRGVIMVGRPLLGVAILIGWVEYARTRGNTHGLVWATVWISLLVGVLALLATQWSGKSEQFRPILNVLPILTNIPGTEGGFNANEIAGAMTWLAPMASGLMLYRLRDNLSRRSDVILAFALLAFALFLGQSRAALIGVLVAIAAQCFLLLPSNRWRYLALTGVAAAAILEVMLVANLFVPMPAVDPAVQASNPSAPLSDAVTTINEQADVSLSPRFGMWESAIKMIIDYPLTGIGISWYRYEPVRSLYPIPDVPAYILAHAHNELLQIGTDLGFPGMLVFILFYVTAAQMGWTVWRHGTADERAVVIAAGGGLLAHAVFGLNDAIPLSDRFAFLFWWMLGLVSAQYVLVDKRMESEPMKADAEAMESVRSAY